MAKIIKTSVVYVGSTLELLLIMKNNQNLFENGLCEWAYEMYYKNLINRKERIVLETYIEENRPSMFESVDSFVHTITDKLNLTCGYYWSCGELEPRIEWIEKHIKINNKK